MEMYAQVNFKEPKEVDFLNSDFVLYFSDYLENALGGMPCMSMSSGRISVEWYFDTDNDGTNTEMLRLLDAVVSFLVDRQLFTSGMEFRCSVEHDDWEKE